MMKVALVTGAAKGIGRAVAERLAADGSCLILMDTDAAALVGVAKAIGPQAITVTGSVADSTDCAKAVAQAQQAFGRLDHLSHNAGIQRYGTVADTSDALWAEVIGTNLTGAFNIARAALPALRLVKGSVVMMASVNSFAAQSGAAAYVVSKHGMVGLIRAMALDEARHGVRVNGVAPGSVDTPMLRDAVERDPNPAALNAAIDAMHPLGRRGTAEEIAALVAFLLSDAAAFITGEIVRADGGLLAAIPGAPRTKD